MGLALLLLVLGWSAVATAHYRHHGAVVLPDSLATPGVVVTSDTAVICRRGYATRARAADSARFRRLRGPVYRAYGVTAHAVIGHQFDHLIPVELGGATAQGNLWPQPIGPSPAAAAKDQVENRLRRRVCAGLLSLPTVQAAIARDWYAAAMKYP